MAHQNNYGGVQVFMLDLIRSLNWTPEKSNRIFWAVGNHDISRESKLRKMVIHSIRNAENKEKRFEEYIYDPEICKVLHTNGMSRYLSWHKEILCQDAYSVNSLHSWYKLIDLNLIVLNTCLTSCDKDDEHNLCIKEIGLQKIFDGLDPFNPTFVIGHHGKEFFTLETQKSLGHLFDTKNVDLYLCGHSHWLGYDVFQQASRELPQITCGGGTLDDYSGISFMHGYYDSERHEVTIQPYSYAERGNRNWQLDRTLHWKLDGENKIPLTGKRSIPPPIRHRVYIDNNGGTMESATKEWQSSFFASSKKNRKDAL